MSASGREAVLILHGFLMNRYVMHPLQAVLQHAGFEAQAFAYRSIRGTLSEHLEALAGAIAALSSQGVSRVHLVGHSMGGVVALAYLLRSHESTLLRSHESTRSARTAAGERGAPDLPAVTGRVVLLGSPVAGCSAAQAFEQQLTGKLLMGKSASLWKEAMPLRIPPRAQVGAIAGNERFGLGSMLVKLQGQNDGVTCVAETHLPGMADHMLMPVSHTGMLFSAQVARQCVAFLRDGHFVRTTHDEAAVS